MKILKLIITGFFLFHYGCGGEEIDSTFKNKPIFVDGKGNEWNDYPLQFNEDFNVVYGIVNNDSALYCMIRFNDQQLARMMSVRGFTLWVNNSGDEEKLMGIHYRDQRPREDIMEMMRPRPGQQDQQKVPDQKIIYPRGRFSLARNDTITDFNINDIYGINAAAGLDNGLYCFEFSMALKKSAGIVYSLGVKSGDVIKVGMEIAAVSEEEQERMKKEMEGRRESMGNGRGGGRPGGGRPSGGTGGGMMGGGRSGGGMRGDRPQMPDMDGDIFWMTVQLAAGNNNQLQ